MSDNNPTNPMPADLLNQILAELKNNTFRLDAIEFKLDRVEARQVETNKLDSVMGAIAVLNNDVKEIRAEMTEFKKEVRGEFRDINKLFHQNITQMHQTIPQLHHNITQTIVHNERIAALEEHNKPKN